MSIFKKIKKLFQKKEVHIAPNHERTMRDLLRENLSTVAVDVFYHDDPIVLMNAEERQAYLLYFRNLVLDKKLISRLKFFINKQANITLMSSKDGVLDTAGVMKMDGTSIIIDDIERLSAMFLKEESEKGRIMDPKDALKL